MLYSCWVEASPGLQGQLQQQGAPGLPHAAVNANDEMRMQNSVGSHAIPFRRPLLLLIRLLPIRLLDNIALHGSAKQG